MAPRLCACTYPLERPWRARREGEADRAEAGCTQDQGLRCHDLAGFRKTFDDAGALRSPPYFVLPFSFLFGHPRDGGCVVHQMLFSMLLDRGVTLHLVTFGASAVLAGDQANPSNGAQTPIGDVPLAQHMYGIASFGSIREQHPGLETKLICNISSRQVTHLGSMAGANRILFALTGRYDLHHDLGKKFGGRPSAYGGRFTWEACFGQGSTIPNMAFTALGLAVRQSAFQATLHDGLSGNIRLAAFQNHDAPTDGCPASTANHQTLQPAVRISHVPSLDPQDSGAVHREIACSTCDAPKRRMERRRRRRRAHGLAHRAQTRRFWPQAVRAQFVECCEQHDQHTLTTWLTRHRVWAPNQAGLVRADALLQCSPWRPGSPPRTNSRRGQGDNHANAAFEMLLLASCRSFIFRPAPPTPQANMPNHKQDHNHHDMGCTTTGAARRARFDTSLAHKQGGGCFFAAR
ncbi:hypothetical protein S40293_11334 [Stachybotrys chartarum IBT 40293]|nr:hypothetical protein S40293_11334 [Stachybotrys chartarum IBT 40293]